MLYRSHIYRVQHTVTQQPIHMILSPCCQTPLLATHIYVPRNLGIHAILKLCTSFMQSRDRTISVENPGSFHCVFKPPAPRISGKFAHSEKLPPPPVWVWQQRDPQTRGVPPFKASPTRRALNSIPLVSSDTLTLLVHYVCGLCLRNLKISTQFPVLQRNLKIAQILRLRRTYFSE